MKVCIAEKPSVAREIAEVLGATQRMNGYIEGNGYQVTWTFGHLCTLKEPHEYAENWKRWSLGSLPMIPPRFGIKLIENPTYEQQFKVIESLTSVAALRRIIRLRTLRRCREIAIFARYGISNIERPESGPAGCGGELRFAVAHHCGRRVGQDA